MRYEIVARSRRDRLGEGPVWLDREGLLAWVDIDGQAVHARDLATGEIFTTQVEEPIGWVLPRESDARLLAGFQSGIYLFDLAGGTRTLLVDPEPDRPHNRLNDGKIDSRGRLWTGSKHAADAGASGALYRIDADLTATRVDDGYLVTNGPAFSPDGRTLYHTDSGRRLVYAFALQEDGSLNDRRIWCRFEDAWGYPDGMTVDAEGCLWIAHWGGGAISRFDPDGHRIDHIALPATNITSCTFAGPGLDRLFVTSSTIGAAAEPWAGALFEVDAGVKGVAGHRFAGG